MSTIKSYTEKAKAYDSNYKNYAELINRLEDVKEAIKKQNYGIAMDVLCKPYPEFQVTTHSELKESEGKDEKIRKALIRAFKSLNTIKVWNGIERTDIIAWLEKQGNLMKALQISNARIGELIEKNYYLKEQLEKQGNNMGISEATKQKLEDNLNKALEKETPESWNKFLDEQGEQKPVFEMKTPEESLGIDSDTYNKIVDECIYGEQKFKIEEGKWYVCTQTYVLRGKIVVIKGQTYQAEKDNAIKGEDECLFIDKHDGKASEYFRLWTIQDAKDGDVLFQDLMGGKTFIYNGVNSNMAILYSFIISNDGEDILPYNIGKPNTGIGNIEENKNIIHPATKEQRDLLFQKMHEAGYKWDAEKKELKNVEQKPAAWSEEDEKQARQIERIVHDDGCTQKLQKQIADFIELGLKAQKEEEV